MAFEVGWLAGQRHTAISFYPVGFEIRHHLGDVLTLDRARETGQALEGRVHVEKYVVAGHAFLIGNDLAQRITLSHIVEQAVEARIAFLQGSFRLQARDVLQNLPALALAHQCQLVVGRNVEDFADAAFAQSGRCKAPAFSLWQWSLSTSAS